MRYTVVNGTYNGRHFSFERAVCLMSVLRKAKIDSQIVVGGLGIYPGSHQEIDMMVSICKNFGVEPKRGLSSYGD